MRADFSLLLVILTVITGVLWALDRYRWEPARRRSGGGGRPGWSSSAGACFRWCWPCFWFDPFSSSHFAFPPARWYRPC